FALAFAFAFAFAVGFAFALVFAFAVRARARAHGAGPRLRAWPPQRGSDGAAAHVGRPVGPAPPVASFTPRGPDHKSLPHVLNAGLVKGSTRSCLRAGPPGLAGFMGSTGFHSSIWLRRAAPAARARHNCSAPRLSAEHTPGRPLAARAPFAFALSARVLARVR